MKKHPMRTAFKTMHTTHLNRRAVVKACIAVAGLTAPLYAKGALSSSGQLNLMGWAGFPDLPAKVFPAFEKATGIRVIFTEQPDLASMFAQAKLSLQTSA